jgi:hypothetical protein
MSGMASPAVTAPSRHAISPCTIDWGWTITSSRSEMTLTASGGPFRTWTRERIAAATPAEAAAHPTWSMGMKIHRQDAGAVALGVTHEGIARADEALLVGERDGAPEPESLHA